MPRALVLTSHGANSIENENLFLITRQLKWGTVWSCYAIGTDVTVT